MFNKYKQQIIIAAAFILGIVVQFINPFSGSSVAQLSINAIRNYTIGDTLYLDCAVGNGATEVENKDSLQFALVEAGKDEVIEGKFELDVMSSNPSRFTISFDLKNVTGDFEVLARKNKQVIPIINSIKNTTSFDLEKTRLQKNEETYFLEYMAKDLLQIENYNTLLEANSGDKKYKFMVQDYVYDPALNVFYISVLQPKVNVGTEYVAYRDAQGMAQNYVLYQTESNDNYIKHTYQVAITDGVEEVLMYIKVANGAVEAGYQNPQIIKFNLKNESNRL